MQKMTYETINNSVVRAMADSHKAKAALIEVAGAEIGRRFITAVGTVFAGLVRLEGLEIAATYRGKQGWKLASNYNLDSFINTYGFDREDEYCDFIEAEFRLAVLGMIETAYADRQRRKEPALKWNWEWYGYHAEEAPAELAA